jgi:hypothetical protein
MTFWRRWFLRRRTHVCMRLADMTLVHPDQIERQCYRCGHTVGVYPSGQQVLAEFDPRIDIVCQCCADSTSGQLAPGALAEPSQSVRRQ